MFPCHSTGRMADSDSVHGGSNPSEGTKSSREGHGKAWPCGARRGSGASASKFSIKSLCVGVLEGNTKVYTDHARTPVIGNPSMAGEDTLNVSIGVRIPVPEPSLDLRWVSVTVARLVASQQAGVQLSYPAPKVFAVCLKGSSGMVDGHYDPSDVRQVFAL